MNKKNELTTVPKGFFPLRISAASGLIQRFLETTEFKYDIIVMSAPRSISENTKEPPHPDIEEALIAVPFSNKEMVRIDFNIFASEMETSLGVTTDFRMESAYSL